MLIQFQKELLAAEQSWAVGNSTGAWGHLERAHILSQPLWREHLQIHLKMLSYAIRQRNLKEVLGQIPRLLLAAPGSLFGRAPAGNPGTVRVGIFDKAELPEDLKKYLGIWR